MRIGIDIDNVISKFNEELLKEYIKHDKELRNTGIVNENADYIRRGMFDWTEDEEINFYRNNIERIAKNLKVKDGAKEYIDKLISDGHLIYIITGRDNGEYSDPYNMTKKWLDDNSIKYHSLIFTNAYRNDKHGKTEKCKENNIDVMIDDSVHICQDCIDNNITTLLMDTPYNKLVDMPRVHNWEEIYEFISNYKQEKINVILDTDTYNECDDQFALAYMLKSQDIFNIEAITVAPYSHKNNNLSVKEGQENSYNEILKICKWLEFDTTNKVFKGAEDYISNGYNKNNDAVDKIIEIALKNDKTYIMAIGAITNVALAIKKEPKIIEKIEVIWLGGHSLLQSNNQEFNFKQDIDAVRIVFDSKVKLTIIPCKNVASNLIISVHELNYYLKDKNELCNYLIDRFYNDGYHGVQERRVIWDISVIAYIINKSWFTSKEISYPNIKDDTSYELTNDRHKITMVNYMDVNKVYKDLFRKLSEDCNKEYDVYFGGTCNNSIWREELIKKLSKKVSYINPKTTNWNHEIEMKMRKEKQKCKYVLYVITSEMKGVLAIANLVDLANKAPERLLFCYIKEGFDEKQKASLEEVKFLLKEHNVKTFENLNEVAEFINNIK